MRACVNPRRNSEEAFNFVHDPFEERVMSIVAMFQALEVCSHSLAAPGVIFCDSRDLVPVAFWPANGDHRVVDSASANGGCSWIKNSVTLAIPLGIRLFGVGVMLYEELPAEIG